jgi:hypothetical protein
MRRIAAVLAGLALLATPALAQQGPMPGMRGTSIAPYIKPFTWYPGVNSNGIYGTSLTLMTTELNSLAAAGLAVSSVGGVSGEFTNANTNQVIFSPVVLTLGAIGSALSAGANVSCWFLQSPDGTHFESSSFAPARPPDVVFALPAATITAGTIFLNQGTIVRVPALPFYVLCQNNTGQTLAASGNMIALVPTAMIH